MENTISIAQREKADRRKIERIECTAEPFEGRKPSRQQETQRPSIVGAILLLATTLVLSVGVLAGLALLSCARAILRGPRRASVANSSLSLKRLFALLRR